ncbi:MAG: RNA methyltransferase [Muribaculaceae bacterium]|nr:RNA methyltransferase [Muribaculaceae bacterium]
MKAEYHIINIETPDDERVRMYVSLTESQLRNKLHPDEGIFIAESPKVIRVAMQAGYRPLSMLCEEKHIAGDAAEIIAANEDMPVFTGSRETLSRLTGYTLTRGVLCAMRRPAPLTPAEVCRGAKRIAVIDDVTDTTNIGAIFRSAAALGIDGILLSPTACDPLNRRAIRVSMGTVFLIPWAYLNDTDYLSECNELGFKTVAMALRDDSVSIDDPRLVSEPRLAIILGTEGEGLPASIIEGCDYVARIPMARNVDSLNVAAASAVAFWQLRSRHNNGIC